MLQGKPCPGGGRRRCGPLRTCQCVAAGGRLVLRVIEVSMTSVLVRTQRPAAQRAVPIPAATTSGTSGALPPLVYVGTAAFNSARDAVQLVPPSMGDQAGAVWAAVNPAPVGSASFTFFILSTTANTGDGFCFVLQTNGTDTLGGGGSGCGYSGLQPSIGLCLRTYSYSQTIGAYANGVLPYPELAHPLPYDVTGGQSFTVAFGYTAATGAVTYTLQKASGGPVTTWTDTVGTLQSIFGTANPQVYAGLTAGDGTSWQAVYISALQVPYPSSLATMALVGNAVYLTASIKLTSPNVGSQAGAAWAPVPVPVSTASFTFVIASSTTNTGDGFCFVYQTNGTRTLGGGGSACGYSPNIGPSIGLCLRTYNYTGGQTIGAYANGTMPYPYLAHPLPYQYAVLSRKPFNVTLEYSGIDGTVAYAIQAATGGPVATWTDTVGSLPSIFGTANPLVYAGMTASDGVYWQGVFITAFSTPATGAASVADTE